MRPPNAPEAGPNAPSMPREMRAFAMPELPESGACPPPVLQLLQQLRAACAACAAGAPGGRFSLDGLGGAELTLLDQLLGEGEVSARLADGARLRVRESAFAGVWQVRQAADGPHHPRLFAEVGALPQAVLAAAEQGMERPAIPAEPPEGLMNGPALLEEIRQQLTARGPGDPPHVINFTLLPVSAGDFRLLEQALGSGALTLLSRGYGDCRIAATGVRRVWRVQYFNASEQPILDSLEITDMPQPALATTEDLADSARRLGELLQWLETSA